MAANIRLSRYVSLGELAKSKTLENLRAAFAGESQANRRYTYFSRRADEEGYPEISALFRAVAEGETAHALRHFDYMKSIGDPVTKVAVPDVKGMLESAVKGETYECTEMYPEFAKKAREEGFDDIAKWFDTLTKAERAHAGKFQEALNHLK
jgi:rubrerythrin